MKKWLIALTIIFGAGLLTSASLAGRIYFKEATVYTDYDKQIIDLTNTKSIYINSDIPVEIKPTTGEAYVEFNQSFEDILGKNPEFKLDVETKGDSCYINLEQIKYTDISFIIKRDEAILTVYLPVQALDTLQIQHPSYRGWYERPQIDLTGIDVKAININQDNSNITLDGKYENINITSSGSSNININSKQKAQVTLEGAAQYNLVGNFENVDINGQHSSVNMNALEATNVIIDAYSSNVKLEGDYSQVKVLGEANLINVKTNTLSDIEIENNSGEVILDGPLNRVKLNTPYSNIDIQTTVNSKSIEIEGEQNNTTLRLPSNIPGFKIIPIISESDDGEYQINDNGDYLKLPNINSEFLLNKQETDIYTYGDSSLKMMVQIGSGLRIVDNGYMIAE